MKLPISIYEKVKEASEGVSALILEPDSPSPLLILLISPAKHQTDDQTIMMMMLMVLFAILKNRLIKLNKMMSPMLILLISPCQTPDGWSDHHDDQGGDHGEDVDGLVHQLEEEVDLVKHGDNG